jgi:hypothetical protein
MCMLTESAPKNFTYTALRGCDPLPTFDEIEELVVTGGFEFLVLDSLYRTGLLPVLRQERVGRRQQSGGPQRLSQTPHPPRPAPMAGRRSRLHRYFPNAALT